MSMNRLQANAGSATQGSAKQRATSPATLDSRPLRHSREPQMPKKSAVAKSDVAQENIDHDDTPADIGPWLTRTEVAELLRVSVTTVRRLQGRDLHPERS